MKLGSLFSGSGGFELSGALCGIEPVWASEIEPFPIRVTTLRFPNMKHLGSVTDIHGDEVEPVDIITFGSPCFPAETLVLTESGYIPICDVKVGTAVLTHTGQWHKVTAVGAKPGSTVILKGNHYGLECTPNHPIYSARFKRDCSKKESGKRNNTIRLTDQREWVSASDMEGRLYGVPNAVETIRADIPVGFTEDKFDRLLYMAGRWLGDGWVRDSQRPHRPFGSRYADVVICDSKDKLPELVDTVLAVNDKYSVEECRRWNSVKVKFNSREICDWLTRNFGKYASGKTIPGWLFGAKRSWQEAVLRGLLDSDGHLYAEKNEFRISTVSKKLAESIRLLGEILGYSTTVFFTKTNATTIIEGRTVNQRDYYTVALNFNNKRNHLSDNLHGWYKVRKILPGKKETTVWNLTVDTDNSYVADGIVVHNCQDLSVAGKQAGIHDGQRSNLFFEAIRIIKEMRNATANKFPRFAVWENVPGAFSSNKGEDFKAVLQAFCEAAGSDVSVPEPPKGGWKHAGCVVGDGFSVAWRIYDAQYWGVPQRRKRIYLIADFGSERAGEILFEPESMSGDSEPGRTERKRASAYVAGCPDGGCFFLWETGADGE